MGPTIPYSLTPIRLNHRNSEKYFLLINLGWWVGGGGYIVELNLKWAVCFFDKKFSFFSIY